MSIVVRTRGRRIVAGILGTASVAVLLALAAASASIAATISGVAPDLLLADVPFTRNPTVELIVMPSAGNTGVVVERRASNDPTVTDGVLVNGSAVAELSQWTLAAGPDGPRTVYAQLKFQDGSWSPIASATIQLDQDPGTSLYFDIDAPTIFYDSSTGGIEPDWHERSSTPGTSIVGRGLVEDDEPYGFSVGDEDWSFTFVHLDGPIAPGVYDADPEPSGCTGTCATVSRTTSCMGDGTVTIHAITFTADGDLQTLAADFRLDCSIYGVMSGSMRYGSTLPIDALDQSRDHVQPGIVDVGDQSDHVVTVTNIGTRSMDLGDATIAGETPDDYALVADGCSGETLVVDESCSVTVRFAPTSRGSRFALLEIPDETARGARRVRLTGSGAHPTTLAISADLPDAGPGPAEVTVIVTPATVEPSRVLVRRDGGTASWTRTVDVLSDPPRLRIRLTMTLTPGQHEIGATFDGFDYHHPATPAAIDVDVPDTGAAWGWMQVVGGTYATSRNVQLTGLLDDPDLTIDKLAISNDGVTWTERVTSTPTGQAWTLTPGNGLKTVYLRWHEGPTDRWSPVVTDTITLDADVPTVTAPRRGFVAGTGLAAGRITTRIPWSGGDVGTGIARYELQQQTDGGDWVQLWSGNYIAINRALATEHTFRFRVRAVDVAGNTSAWATGDSFRVARYNEHNPAIRYTGTWTTVADADALGGARRSSTRAAATASLTVTGRSIAWLAPVGPDRGKAEVFVNGSRVATVDLYAASPGAQRVVWVGSSTTVATRTVTIKVLGTSGRPRVDLDAFITAN